MAYEAATADLNDINMIDPWHLEAYGKTTVNYNRDVEIFPVLKATFERMYGTCPYKSPTDMGVNMAGNCIFDNDAVSEASLQEIVRRYYNAVKNAAKGAGNKEEIYKLELLMNQAGISAESRPCAAAAHELAAETDQPAAAAELKDGTIVTGKTSALLGCASATLLNALKHLAGINDDVLLIGPDVIKPIQELKINHLGNKNPRLHTDEVLIALAISATADENAAKAMHKLCELKNCEMHSSVLLAQVDENVLKKLGVRLTSEPAKNKQSIGILSTPLIAKTYNKQKYLRRTISMKKPKYIFVTGGVVSGLGKGITAASLGRLLKSRGLKVTAQKLDPYLNVDPGTMNPVQHGEVFVTDDGAETDLDLGHYERFIDESLSQNSNLTSGRVYWKVITDERKGVYGGQTIQIIPHVTNEIKNRFTETRKREPMCASLKSAAR